MTTIYGVYFTNFDYTDWGFRNQADAVAHAKKSGFEYIIRETTGYLEDYI